MENINQIKIRISILYILKYPINAKLSISNKLKDNFKALFVSFFLCCSYILLKYR